MRTSALRAGASPAVTLASDRSRIRLVDALEVRRDGEAMTLPASRKTRALLAYLVMTGRPHRRERLCGLLWDIPDDPRGALRWSLSKLRRLVDEPGRTRIVADRERVAFVADGVDVDGDDVLVSRAALDDPALPREELVRIVARLERPLLVGLDLPRQPLFQRWLDGRREARAALLAEASGRLAAAARGASAPVAPGTTAPTVVPGAVPITAPALAPSRAPFEDEACGQITVLPRRRTARQRVRFCRAPDGTRIAHSCIGDGPPLVTAAGWPSHLELERGAPVHEPLLETLARGRTLVRHDGRGGGLSARDVGDFSLDARVGDLEAVVDALGFERFALLGTSHGAAAAIEYAARHPARVSRLLLLAPCTVGWRRDDASPDLVRHHEAIVTLAAAEWDSSNPAFRHLFSSLFMPGAPAATLGWFDEYQHQAMSGGNAARLLAALGDVDVRPRLAGLAVPTLVAHARGDQYRPLAHALSLAGDIANAEFVELDGDAHLLLGDEPDAAAFVDAARRWLAS